MVDVNIMAPSAKKLTRDQLHGASRAAADIFFAVSALGYDMDKTTVGVSLLCPAAAGRLQVDLNDKDFGVWDTARKTFVD